MLRVEIKWVRKVDRAIIGDKTTPSASHSNEWNNKGDLRTAAAGGAGSHHRLWLWSMSSPRGHLGAIDSIVPNIYRKSP